MNYSLEELYNKFEVIKKHGWYVVPERGYGRNGLFFENLLGLYNNDLPIADYNGIELKVQSHFSKYPITLFSLSLDGPTPFEIQRFVNSYGVRDLQYPDKKILYIKLSTKEFSKWGAPLRMKLHFDKKNEKLYILVSHSNGKIIEKKAFWDFSKIRDIVDRKLKILCIVYNTTKYLNNTHYIKFDNLCLYNLKNSDLFLSAIENGIVYVQIKYGIYKSGPKAGQSYNHGLAFLINHGDLFMIFDKILQKK